jgi:UrcA family protein
MSIQTSLSRHANRRNAVRTAILIALGALAPIAAIAQSASSTAADDSQAVTVKYGDLDLTRSKDATELLGRIQAAARQTCARYDGRDLHERARYQACADHAAAEAVEKINNPMLSSIYSAKTGRGSPAAVANVSNHL